MELSEQLRNVVERVLLLPVRVRHRRGARPKHKARIAALATTTATLQKARGNRGTQHLFSGRSHRAFRVGAGVSDTSPDFTK